MANSPLRFSARLAPLCVALGACHPQAAPATVDDVSARDAEAGPLQVPTEATPTTHSPQTPRAEGYLHHTCTTPDAGLAAVARVFAQHRVTHGRLMRNDELVFELRRHGLPYVWPTTMLLATSGERPNEVEAKVGEWLDRLPTHAQRRCGAARVQTEAGMALVAVLVSDALADVRPVPRQARVGQWLPLDVQLHVPVEDIEVIALGPTGSPFSLPAHVTASGKVRAQLPLQKAGRWLFQVLPTLEQGPRPVAEVEVFVDTPVPDSFHTQAVPGETTWTFLEEAAPEQLLLAMLNEARGSEGLPPLELNEVLSLVAKSHALAMQQRRQVSHDVGSGDPGARMARLELHPGVVAENVARADSIQGAHRVIWQSPSHRRSLLHDEFTQVGLGVVTDANGEVWVCQLFVDRV